MKIEDSESPELQTSQNISLRELLDHTQGDANNITVFGTANEDLTSIESKVRIELRRKYPWLDRTVPRQQILFEVNGHGIDLLNYMQPLDQPTEEVIREAIDLFEKSVRKSPFLQTRYIFIEPEDRLNPQSGEHFYGEAGTDQAITFFPRAIENGAYRINGVQSLPAVIIHELSHKIATEFMNDWRRLFDWTPCSDAVQTKGGNRKAYECRDSKRCLNEYAATDPEEDFCESMAAALLNPSALDEERLQFIKERVLSMTAKQSFTAIKAVNVGSAVRLPHIQEPVFFTRRTVKGFKPLMNAIEGAVRGTLAE